METGRPMPEDDVAGRRHGYRSTADFIADEDAWKRHTRDGNSAHACGRYVLARHSYARALDLASIGLTKATREEAAQAVPMFVIACHNAGDNLLALGQKTEGLGFYQLAFEQLMELAALSQERPALAAAARGNLTQVASGLMRLMKEFGDPADRIETVLRRARSLNASTLASG